jgi:quinol monooxygenase YgiN
LRLTARLLQTTIRFRGQSRWGHKARVNALRPSGDGSEREGTEPMILFRVGLRVPRDLREPVLKSLRRLAGPTRSLRGCLAAGSYADIEEDNVILYTEEWETQGDLQAHLRSEALRVLLSVMDLASDPPDVRFDRVSETRGMEFLAAARQGQPPVGE